MAPSVALGYSLVSFPGHVVFPLLLRGLGARLDTVQPTSQTFNLPPVGMAIMMTEQQRMLRRKDRHEHTPVMQNISALGVYPIIPTSSLFSMILLFQLAITNT